jgi:hypothetical protein
VSSCRKRGLITGAELSWEPEMNQSELIERLVIAVRRHPYL